MICVIYKDTKTKETFNCDGCKKPICKQCGNLSSSEIKILKLQRGRVMKFHCPKCRNFKTFTLFQDNLAKILEKCLKDRLISFLKSKNILSKNQFGFTENVSTADAMYNLTSEITNSLNESKKGF